MNIKFDHKLALAQFKKRKKQNKGKQVDNSRLYAGSPMYYYCKKCGCETDVLPESHLCLPKRICESCEVLVAHGLV